MDHLNESLEELWVLFNGKTDEIPVVPVFIDVRDRASITVAVLTNEKARNQRYLAVAGHFTTPQLMEIVRGAFPDQARRLLPTPPSPPPHFKTGCRKIESDFGISWIPLERSIIDTAAALFIAEKELVGSSH
ncbi:hypothetical protein CALCODRAFT_496845 [Calocera cornea HHB12733]|uniref:Uncharacterized protein n=1 Tax=Calocera cornea HHB12733 TaxID=1353952 RepID=A0A165FJP1_9BASI|nr:hypothetical protein CALCODRAFT_496845 [Calocera cornea HHB12733]